MRLLVVILLLAVSQSTLIADSLFVKVFPDTIKYYHLNTSANCASGFVYEFYQSSDTIFFHEVDTSLQLMTCGCSFNIHANLTGIGSGNYHFVVKRIHLAGEDTIYIGTISLNVPKDIPGLSAVSGFRGSCDKFSSAEDEHQTSVPDEYYLENNYPNPFNPATIISFSIPKDGFVDLKIYDLLGKEIATLVQEYKTSGSYSVKFNAADLPSGIYIYKIKSGLFSQTKKLVLLK